MELVLPETLLALTDTPEPHVADASSALPVGDGLVCRDVPAAASLGLTDTATSFTRTVASASKLRRAILRAERIRADFPSNQMVSAGASVSTTATAVTVAGKNHHVTSSEAAWIAAEKDFADGIIAVTVREVKRRRGEHCAGVSQRKADIIRANVHSWAIAARRQGSCTGTETDGVHAACNMCPGMFRPETFFCKGIAEFAHWNDQRRNGDPSQLIRNRCRSDDNAVFIQWLQEKGRFLDVCWHALETAANRRY